MPKGPVKSKQQSVKMTPLNKPLTTATDFVHSHASEFKVDALSHFDNDASHLAGSGSRKVGVVSLLRAGTPYDALAEVLERGFYPAFAVEMFSLWSVDRRPWDNGCAVAALADACRWGERGGRAGLALKALPPDLARAFGKQWEVRCVYMDPGYGLETLPQGTGIAVTHQTSGIGRQRKPIFDTWLAPTVIQLRERGLEKLRAKARGARGSKRIQYEMDVMVAELLIEISNKLDKVPDRTAFEKLSALVAEGAILNHNEQVDIYNQLLGIKNATLGRYREHDN